MIKQRTKFDKNEIITAGDFSYIVLYDKHNKEIARTKIDTFNVDIVTGKKWYLRPDGYVATNNYNGKYTYLHKIICSDKSKIYVDHKNRDRLDNTVDNLRVADGFENAANKGVRSDNTSGKVGVHWSSHNQKWCAMICVKGKHMNLGYFKHYGDAVECRVSAEKKYFGEFQVKDEKNMEKIGKVE